MSYEGDFTTANTIYHLFNTFSSNDPAASVAVAGFALSDIAIYKNGSTTQRASAAGYTLLGITGIDFDGVVGIGGFSIDLSDDTDAGFYSAGDEYHVVIGPVTIDDGVVNFVACNFSIERTGGALALAKGSAGFAAIDAAVDGIATQVGTDGVVLSSAQMNKVADHVIRRNSATVRASSDGDTVDNRSLLGAVSKLHNKVAVVGTDLVAYEEDDTTAFLTQALTTNASAEPITSMDTV